MNKIMPFALGLALMAGFTSCSDDDDINPSKVPTAVKTSFDKMFPGIKKVDWQQKSNYYVADFDYNTFDTDAWYASGGDWAMTETDYGSLVSMLPIEVQTAFNASEYADWIVDDAKYYERTADSFCIIEVETDGIPDVALFYDTEGNIINMVQGDYFDITPNTIVSNISF